MREGLSEGQVELLPDSSRPENFGEREVQNLVLLRTTFVHQLLHY